MKNILRSQLQVSFYLNPLYWELKPRYQFEPPYWGSFSWLFFAAVWYR